MANPFDDMFSFDPNVDPNASNYDRPDLGRGVYALKRYYVKETFKKGNILVAELITIKPSPTNPKREVGSQVSVAWLTSETGMKGKYEKARANGFVAALLGRDSKENCGPISKRLCADDQPGTGICLIIEAKKNGEYTNLFFEHIPGQTPDVIKATRAKLEQMASYTPSVPATAPAPTVAATPSIADVTKPAATSPASNPFAGLDIPF